MIKSLCRLSSKERVHSSYHVYKRCYLSSFARDDDEEKREYFYVIDDKGQLFLDDCPHRNFVSCFKEKIFLQRFYSWLRPNTTGKFAEAFPWISPCGTKEVNYIRIEDSVAPIAFGDLLSNNDSCLRDSLSNTKVYLEDQGPLLLGIGSSVVTEPFAPHLLRIDDHTGRFYHPISLHKYMKGRYGLLHPKISQLLSDRIFVAEEGQTDHNNTNCVIHWGTEQFPIIPIGKR